MPGFMPALQPPMSVDRRALISCVRCRRLKKKCEQKGRARCQRCIETDQVCRYADMAEENAERCGSVSPPPSPTTKLIFPAPMDYPGAELQTYPPSPPPAVESPQIYSLLYNRPNFSMNEHQPLPGSFQPTEAMSPILDHQMSDSSQYNGPISTTYASTSPYSQYSPTSIPQQSAYDIPVEYIPPHMESSKSLPSERGSASPTQSHPYIHSQFNVPYQPWDAPTTVTAAQEPYSRAPNTMQTNAVASTSRVTSSYNYNAPTYYDTGASEFSRGAHAYYGCPDCHRGRCTIHGGG